MKYKLNIQFFGGRGAWSGTGQSSSGSGRMASYKDVTDQFRGMNLFQFEDAIRDRKTEYLGVFDKDGNLKIAVTSNSPHAVGIPVAEATGEAVLTHNHPYQPRDETNRMIGGTFSEADVMNHIGLKVGQTRAVSNGPNENTYIIRKGKNADSNGLYNVANKSARNNTAMNNAKKQAEKIKKDMALRGYSQSAIEKRSGQIKYGLIKHFWKSNASKYGYEYIEIKKGKK